MRTYWDLGTEGASRQRLWGVVMTAGLLGNLALGGLHVGIERRAPVAIRTAEGHSDLVVLPREVAPRGDEAKVWIEELALRMFSWDDTTVDGDRALVKGRVTSQVWGELPGLVPGFLESQKQGKVKGRVDVELRATRIIGDGPEASVVDSAEASSDGETPADRSKPTEEAIRERLKALAPPFMVEVQMAITFSGEYTPPRTGLADPVDPRRELYGFIFTVEYVGRSRQNVSGLVVTKMRVVEVQGAAA